MILSRMNMKDLVSLALMIKMCDLFYFASKTIPAVMAANTADVYCVVCSYATRECCQSAFTGAAD